MIKGNEIIVTTFKIDFFYFNENFILKFILFIHYFLLFLYFILKLIYMNAWNQFLICLFHNTKKVMHMHKSVEKYLARSYLSYGDKWLVVLFSDENKWNLDGPDVWNCYWHDLRKQTRTFYSRRQGSKSLMIWWTIGFNEQTSPAFLK